MQCAGEGGGELRRKLRTMQAHVKTKYQHATPSTRGQKVKQAEMSVELRAWPTEEGGGGIHMHIYAIDSWVLTKSKLSEYVRNTWLTDIKRKSDSEGRERERKSGERGRGEQQLKSSCNVYQTVSLIRTGDQKTECLEAAFEGVSNALYLIENGYMDSHKCT